MHTIDVIRTTDWAKNAMFVFLPDTALIFSVSAVVIVLSLCLRLVVYLRSRKAR